MAERALVLEGASQHLPSQAAGCLPVPVMPRARFGPRPGCTAPGGCFSLLCFCFGPSIYNKQKKQRCSLGRLPSLPVPPAACARNLPQPTQRSSENIKAGGIRVGRLLPTSPEAAQPCSVALGISHCSCVSPHTVAGGWLGFWGQLFFRRGSELPLSRLNEVSHPSLPSPPQIRTQ